MLVFTVKGMGFESSALGTCVVRNNRQSEPVRFHARFLESKGSAGISWQLWSRWDINTVNGNGFISKVLTRRIGWKQFATYKNKNQDEAKKKWYKSDKNKKNLP